MTDTKIIDKIRGLLALGDKSRNTSEAEAQAALLKAHELMAKYGVDVAVSSETEVTYTSERCNSKYNCAFRKPLAVVISENFKVKTYLMGSGGDVVFFGHHQDVLIAKEVFEFVYEFLRKGSERAYAAATREGRPTKGVYGSYTLGFIAGLKKSLGEQSLALMVVTPEDVVDKFNEMSADFKKGTGGVRCDRLDPKAYREGERDGNSILAKKRLEA